MHTSFIGWKFLNESTTNSVCSCTDASTTKLLGTWWTTAHTSVSDVAYRQRLRCSASSHEVSVPRYRLSTYGRRAFAVAGPTDWNSFPEHMWDPEVSEDSYRQSLKTFLFAQYYTVFRKKNTHSHFLPYIHEWCVDLNKNCSEYT